MNKTAWIGMMALICLALTVIPVNASDYVVGENVTIFMQLMDDGMPIPDSTCLMTILYPNMTVFMDDVQMDYLSDSGIFYHDLVAPEPDGIYITYAICNITEPYMHNISGSGELHISIPESHCNYVGGTEYTPGDIGMVAIQVLKTAAGNPVPVADAACTVDIYYPNTSLFISSASSPYIPASNGVYSHNFTIPGDLGVYTADFDCTYPPGSRKAYGSGTFHVSLNLTAEEIWNYTIRTLTDYNQTEMFELLFTINDTTFNTLLLLLNLTVGNVSVSADINYTELTMQVWDKNNQFRRESDILSLADGVIQTTVTTPSCFNDTILIEVVNVTQCILGTCTQSNYEIPFTCEYGCVNRQCRPSPITGALILFGIIFLMAIIFGVSWWVSKKK